MREPVFAILHTAERTAEALKAEWPEVTEAEAINHAKIYAMMDGQKAMLMPDIFGQDDYNFIILADEKMNREVSYQLEQDPMFGVYHNDRAAFDKAYDSGGYARDTTYCIEKKYVEIISAEEFAAGVKK